MLLLLLKLQVCSLSSLEVPSGLTRIPALGHVHTRDERGAGTLPVALVSSAPACKNSVGSGSLVRIRDKVDLLTSALPVFLSSLQRSSFYLRPVIPLSPITPLTGAARRNVIRFPFFFTLWCSLSLNLTQSLFPFLRFPPPPTSSPSPRTRFKVSGTRKKERALPFKRTPAVLAVVSSL